MDQLGASLWGYGCSRRPEVTVQPPGNAIRETDSVLVWLPSTSQTRSRWPRSRPPTDSPTPGSSSSLIPFPPVGTADRLHSVSANSESTQLRRLAAIAVMDVVGYSRMMSEDEDGTLTVLQAHRNELEPVLRNHGARVVKGTGDGMLIEVPSAVEAVKAALETQRLMAERNVSVPEARKMQFRIGINLGDVIVGNDEDLFGHGL
jgi:hypothetical protein